MTQHVTRHSPFAIRHLAIPSLLADFTIPSVPDNERQAMAQVAAAVAVLNLPADRLERLKTAVGEATMNAMEHGNRYDPDLPVAIQVRASADLLTVSITHHGGGQEVLDVVKRTDMQVKLAGLQSPCAWWLDSSIRSMVDEMHVTSDEVHHTIELVMKLKGEEDASPTV